MNLYKTTSDLFLFSLTLISAHSFWTMERIDIPFYSFIFSAVFFALKKDALRRNVSIVFLCFFAAVFFLSINLPYVGRLFWPVDLFIASTIFWFLVRKIGLLPDTKIDWKIPNNKFAILSVPAIVIPSLVCLLIYYRFYPEVANQWPLPEMPVWAIPLAVLTIALVNGLREEFYYRFLLQSTLVNKWSKFYGLLCTSVLFGYMHFSAGFPQGYWGVLLTSLFGFIIGLQYIYFESRVLTWATHSITDAVMFAVILMSRG